MPEEPIEIEADSLEEARKLVPDGRRLMCEKVLDDGLPRSDDGVAATVEAALEAAISKVPRGATILEEKGLNPDDFPVFWKQCTRAREAITGFADVLTRKGNPS